MCFLIVGLLFSCCAKENIVRTKNINEPNQLNAVEDVYPGDYGKIIEVNSAEDDQVEMLIDELEVRISYGSSFDKTYRIHERLYGTSFPQIYFTIKSNITVHQTEKDSILNITIIGSNVTFKGPNPVTPFRWHALKPHYSDEIEVHFETSVPNLRLESDRRIKYYFESSKLEFESIDFSNEEDLNFDAPDFPVTLKLKSINYNCKYDKSGFKNQNNNIKIDVGNIFFFQSFSTITFDLEVTVHDYIKSKYNCSLNIHNFKFDNDNFYFSILPMDNYWKHNGNSYEIFSGIDLHFNDGEKINYPPSGSFNVLPIITISLNSDKNARKIHFAQSVNDINFKLIYDDNQSCDGATSTCSVLRIGKENNDYCLFIDYAPEIAQFVYGSNEEFDENNDIYPIDTVDSRKWKNNVIHPCITKEVYIHLFKSPQEAVNFDVILITKYQIKAGIETEVPYSLKLDLNEQAIGHMYYFAMANYGTDYLRVTYSNPVNFGSHLTLSLTNVIIEDKALSNIKLDSIKMLDIDFTTLEKMKDKILFGTEIDINYNPKVSNDLYFDFQPNSVIVRDEIMSYEIDVKTNIRFIVGLVKSHISAPINYKMNGFIIEGLNIAYDSVINRLDWFPVTNGKTITSASEIIPYSFPSNSIISIVSTYSILQLSVPNRFLEELIEDLIFKFELGKSNINKVKLPDKIAVTYFIYSATKNNSLVDTDPISELKLTGVTFDHILSGAKKTDNKEKDENINTTQLYRRNVNAISKFKQVNATKLIICSGSYVEMLEGNNKPSFVDFIFTPTSFPPFLDTNITFSDVRFTFAYENQDEGTYDHFYFLFNKFVPIAFLRSSVCSDLSLEIANTDSMTVKCEDLWTGVDITNDKKHAVISVKLMTTLIETPSFDKNEFNEIADVEPYKSGNGLGQPAIIGISVGAAVVIIIVVVVVIIVCKRRRGEKSNNSSFGSDGGVQL